MWDFRSGKKFLGSEAAVEAFISAGNLDEKANFGLFLGCIKCFAGIDTFYGSEW